jgi:hypothetical protein
MVLKIGCNRATPYSGARAIVDVGGAAAVVADTVDVTAAVSVAAAEDLVACNSGCLLASSAGSAANWVPALSAATSIPMNAVGGSTVG